MTTANKNIIKWMINKGCTWFDITAYIEELGTVYCESIRLREWARNEYANAER